jgi:hypothetical protein
MYRNAFFRTSIIVIVSTSSTIGWSETAKLDKTIQLQRPANTPEAIRDRAAETFSNAPGLNSDQKLRIKKVYLQTYDSAKDIGMKIGKSKSLLFMTVAEKDYSAKDVEEIKGRIIELDNSRLKIMFSALEEVQKIVGPGRGPGKDRRDLYKHFFDFEEPKYDDVAKVREQ